MSLSSVKVLESLYTKSNLVSFGTAKNRSQIKSYFKGKFIFPITRFHIQLAGASVGYYCHILRVNLTNLHIENREPNLVS